jgi:replicative DNA helicase/5S rRNA maturation endonuclease (ribonuclease M5)
VSEFDAVAYLAAKGHRGTPVSGGREVIYACFMGCEEPTNSKKKKWYLNVEESVYHCKVCEASGGSWTLQKHFGDEPRAGSSNDAFMRQRILDSATGVGEQMLAANDDVLLYLLTERGLTPETVLERKLGFVAGGWSLVGSLPEEITAAQVATSGLVHRDGPRAGRDFFHRHLLIPYLRRGHTIQMRGRAWGEISGGKYLTGPGEPVRLYNGDALEDAEEVIITEGEFDTMILAQTLAAAPEARARKIAVVALPGAGTLPEEFDDVLAGVKRIYLGLDSDQAGRKAADKLKDHLGNRARILTLPAEEGRKCDWTEYLLPGEGPGTWKSDHPYAGHGWRDVLRLLSSAAGKRVFSIAEAGMAYRSFRETNDGLRFGYHELDATINPGLLPGQVVVVLAKTGCLAGDTELQVNRAGKGFRITIADLLDRWEGRRYAWDRKIPTYIQREVDGVVRLGKIKNAWASGVKETYTLLTDSGLSIRATKDHRFLTPRGWRTLDELHVNDDVFVNAGRSGAGVTQPKPNYAKRTVPAHPYAARRNVVQGGHSVPYHRLVMEAHLNGMDPDLFVDYLRDPDADLTGDWTFLDPDVFTVHHLDHDHTNNEIDNLAVLTHRAHHALHGREGKDRHVLEQIGPERIASIMRHAEPEETYDIEMEDEPHNFIANGFVVHNSGKTVLLCNLAYNMRAHKILFLSLEMTREEIYDRLRRIYLFHHPRADDDMVEAGLANIYICDENRLGERDIGALVSEFQVEAETRPDVLLVDYLGYYARGAKGMSPYEKTTNAVMQLKAEAKAGRFVVISPGQVNRVAKEGKPIDLDDARDSGAVEETADFLLALFRPDDALAADGVLNQQPSGKVKISLLKSRHGGKGRVFSLQMDLLTLALVEDNTSAAKKAMEHNYLAWRGHDWDTLRANETAPTQMHLKGLKP